MAKEMIDLTSDIDTVGDLVPIEECGSIVPVRSYGKTLYHLQDGQPLPTWLVWLHRRRGVIVAALALAGAVAAARLLLAERR